MESRARLLGHSLHQILIVFPMGLFVAGVGFDAAALIVGDPHWHRTAYDATLAGLAGGVAAAAAGYVDYRAIPAGTRARSVALLHGIGGALLIALFAASAALRAGAPAAFHPAAFALAVAGLALAGITGWLGGELVTRMGIGVADGAHPDAPGTPVAELLGGGASARRAGTSAAATS